MFKTIKIFYYRQEEIRNTLKRRFYFWHVREKRKKGADSSETPGRWSGKGLN